MNSYVEVYLRKMSWNGAGGTSGETWAYTSNPKRAVKLFGKVSNSTSFNEQIKGIKVEKKNTPNVNLTIWLNDLTNEEASLYQEKGLDVAIAMYNPKDDMQEAEIITLDEYNTILSSTDEDPFDTTSNQATL